MDRKLTEKEIVFLLDLRALMVKHDVMLSADNGHVRIDVGYNGEEDEFEPLILPDNITDGYDLDDVINFNS